jgi:hypothetical protein
MITRLDDPKRFTNITVPNIKQSIKTDKTLLPNKDLAIYVNADEHSFSIANGSLTNVYKTVRPTILSQLDNYYSGIKIQNYIAVDEKLMIFAIMYQGIPVVSPDSDVDSVSYKEEELKDKLLFGIEVFQLIDSNGKVDIISVSNENNLLQEITDEDVGILGSANEQYICNAHSLVKNINFNQNMVFLEDGTLVFSLQDKNNIQLFRLQRTSSPDYTLYADYLGMITNLDIGADTDSLVGHSLVSKFHLRDFFVTINFSKASKNLEFSSLDGTALYGKLATGIINVDDMKYKTGTCALYFETNSSGWKLSNSFSIVINGNDVNIETANTINNSNSLYIHRTVYNKTLDRLYFSYDNKSNAGIPVLIILKGNLSFVRELRLGYFGLDELGNYNVFTNNLSGMTTIISSNVIVTFDGAFIVHKKLVTGGYTENKNNKFNPMRSLVYNISPFTIEVLDSSGYSLSRNPTIVEQIASVTFVNSPNVAIENLHGGASQEYPVPNGATPQSSPILIFKLSPTNVSKTQQFVLIRHRNSNFISDGISAYIVKGANLRVVSWNDPNANYQGSASFGFPEPNETFANYKDINGKALNDGGDYIYYFSKTLTPDDSEYDDEYNGESYLSEHTIGLGWQTDVDEALKSKMVPFFMTYSRKAVEQTVEKLSATDNTTILYNENGDQQVIDSISIPDDDTDLKNLGDTANHEWIRLGDKAPVNLSTQTIDNMRSGKFGAFCTPDKPDCWIAIKTPEINDTHYNFTLIGFLQTS